MADRPASRQFVAHNFEGFLATIVSAPTHVVTIDPAPMVAASDFGARTDERPRTTQQSVPARR